MKVKYKSIDKKNIKYVIILTGTTESVVEVNIGSEEVGRLVLQRWSTTEESAEGDKGTSNL